MRRFDFIVSFVCCALLGYFAWHAYTGPGGYPYQERLERQVAELQAKFDDLQRDRIQFEHRVRLLRPETIDPDMLDEFARRKLEMVNPGDIVAFTDR
jgi:cell division protein FtsB